MAYSALQERQNKNVRKGLQGSVFVALSTAPAVTKASLFDATTGDLKAVPAGYTDLGILTDAGAKLSRAIKQSDLTGWGFTEPVRSDITSDVDTMVIETMETKLETIGLYRSVDPTTIAPDGTNGTIEVPKPSVGSFLTYRVLAVAVDETTQGEIAICRFFPNAKVTNINDQSFANGDSAITWGVTFTAYTDNSLGYAVDDFIGGAGWLANLGQEDDPRVVACTTATSTALVATTGKFFTADVGRFVSGAGIPAGTTIVTFTDSTHVVLSAATTASATGVPVTVS